MSKTELHHYDSAIVLCGNVLRTPEGYTPADYTFNDGFGMSGAHMRVIAATAMHASRQTDTFLFSTGVSKKLKERLGAEVPPEAHIYAVNFMARLAILESANSELSALPDPTILLETRSKNTAGNLRECFRIIQKRGWEEVAIITNDHHVPRVRGLSELVQQEGQMVSARLTYVSAEAVVKEQFAGKYDVEIDNAYASPAGQQRLSIEAQGVEDIKNGEYILEERLPEGGV